MKKKMPRNIILEGKNQNIWIQWLIPFGHVYIVFIVNESDNVGGFPSQRASDAKNISMSWLHHRRSFPWLPIWIPHLRSLPGHFYLSKVECLVVLPIRDKDPWSLRHWCPDKMLDIFQMEFSNWVSYNIILLHTDCCILTKSLTSDQWIPLTKGQ